MRTNARQTPLGVLECVVCSVTSVSQLRWFSQVLRKTKVVCNTTSHGVTSEHTTHDVETVTFRSPKRCVGRCNNIWSPLTNKTWKVYPLVVVHLCDAQSTHVVSLMWIVKSEEWAWRVWAPGSAPAFVALSFPDADQIHCRPSAKGPNPKQNFEHNHSANIS